MKKKKKSKFLSARYKFMAEIHLRQPAFTYRDYCESFKETRYSRYIYKNELDSQPPT